MVFLNPSILFGLLAASIPIIIHFLNFRKLQKVEFSTLSFLKELQKSKIKKIKIKQWLLLLLRTLIIIFLVFAFARPTLESTYFLGTTSSAKSSIAFIVDNSFSMSFVTDKGSLLNKSKTEVKKVISEMNEKDDFVFIFSSDSVITTSSREKAKKIVDDIEISYHNENLISQLNRARTILDNSNNLNKEIYLFSDFQNNAFNDDDSLLKDKSKIKLFAFDVSASKVQNYAITDFEINNTILEPNKTISFKVNLENYSDKSFQNLIVSLFVENERVAQSAVNLEENSSKTLNLETTLKSAGFVNARVEIDEDNIGIDNSRFLSFYIPEKIKILYLVDSNLESSFIEAALRSNSRNRFEVKVIQPEKSTTLDFNSYDILLVQTSNVKTINKISKFIRNGGSAIYFPTNSETLTTILQSSNIQLIEVNKENSNYAEFQNVDFQNPIFNDLYINEKNKKIESPTIFKYLKILPSNEIKSIIGLNDESVFLGEKNIKTGKQIFFNIQPNLEWSNFPIKSIFAPLLNKLVYYATSNVTNTNNFEVGDKIHLNTSNLVYPTISAETPNGIYSINLESNRAKSYSFDKTIKPGNYKFESNENLFSVKSVNLNNSESDIKKIAEDEKKEILENGFDDPLFLNLEDDYLSIIKQARFGTELWKPFLIIVFVLALIEMFVAKSSKKDLTSIK